MCLVTENCVMAILSANDNTKYCSLITCINFFPLLIMINQFLVEKSDE